jgi:hypothetical protein
MTSIHVKDTWDDGTASFVLLTSLDRSIKTGDWKIITTEDWLLRPSVRKNITVLVFEALRRAAQAESLIPGIKGSETQFNVRRASNAVYGLLFGIKTYETMMEDDRLPKQSKDRKLIYELEENVLRVREVPSMAHDAAANALTLHLGAWSQNYNMLAQETLTVLGGGRK